MNKMTRNGRVALSALAFVCAAVASAEEIGGSVMPYSLQACGTNTAELVSRLREISSRSGITRFALCAPGHSVRQTGVLDEAGYAKIGRRLGEIKGLLAADGIDIGYRMMPTMNCGIRHPWRAYVGLDGVVRPFTPCPADEGFRNAFAAKCAAVARGARPFLFMMEDDFRYFGRGCFCETHLNAFGKRVGVRRTREELVRALKGQDAAGLALKRAWHDFQVEALLELADAAGKAIGAVSPETRVGLCAPGGFLESDTARIARALAGGHRPLVRWYGAIYGTDYPIELAGRLTSAQWARENLSRDIECFYESDPVPHSRFYASSARIGALVSSTLAMGFSAPDYWGLSSSPDALATTPDYLDLHRRESARWEAIRREAESGRLVGVQVAFDPAARIGAFGGDPAQTRVNPDWYATLNRMGVPVTTAAASVKVVSGYGTCAYMPEEEVRSMLAGNVCLDGAAAEALTERGFSGLTGVRATKRDKIDFFMEHATGWGGRRTYHCTFHQNYGLDGCAVSRLASEGAESVAVFSNGKTKQPSVTYFENASGGRVAVMAVNLSGCKSPNVFSFAKRDLLVRLFRRMGGETAVPARVLDRANVTLLANDDGKRLFLHALNLSCDPVDSMEFEIGEPYAGRRLDVLDGATWRDAEAVWEGNRARVKASVNVYGVLALRVKRK